MRLSLTLAAALLAACSINVQDGEMSHDDASCSVRCDGGTRVSATCRNRETPRCDCEPAPRSTCDGRKEKP